MTTQKSLLLLTRGLPASGKTTYARNWVAEDPDHRARLNRDDLRKSLFAGEGILPHAQEEVVTQVQQSAARALLTKGTSVVVDDMNLRARYVKDWIKLANKAGATFNMADIDTPVDECVRRDQLREYYDLRSVGEGVIRDLHRRFPDRKPVVFDQVDDFQGEIYHRPPAGDFPRVYLVDIDGTMAHNTGGRGWYEWDRVGEDEPAINVIETVQALSLAGYGIVVMSGRDEECREATKEWLDLHHVPFRYLAMRPKGDMRKDAVVKLELFDRHVRGLFDVVGVIDDRMSVARLWHGLGLTLFKVGDPDAPEF